MKKSNNNNNINNNNNNNYNNNNNNNKEDKDNNENNEQQFTSKKINKSFNNNNKKKEKKAKLNRFIETPPLISSNNTNTTTTNNGRKTPPLFQLNSSPPQTTTTTTTTTTTSPPPTKNAEIPGYYYDVDKNRYFKLTKELQQMLLEKKKKETEIKELPIKLNQTTNNSSIKFKNLSKVLEAREINSNTKITGLDYHIKDIMINNYLSEYKHISSDNVITNLSLFGNTGTSINNSSTKGIISSSKKFITIDWLDCYNDVDNNSNNNLINEENKSYDFEIKICRRGSQGFSMDSDISSIRTNKKDSSMVSICTLGNDIHNGSVWIYSIDSESFDVRCKRNLMVTESSVWCSEWNPINDNIISIGGSNGSAFLYDLINQKLTNKSLSKSDIFVQEFNNSGNLLFNGSRDGIIRTLDTRINSNNIELIINNGKKWCNPHSNSSISSIKSLNDDNYLIVASLNGEISKWDRRVGKKVIEYLHNQNTTSKKMGLSITQDQQYISSAGDDKLIRIWNVTTGSLIKTLGPFSNLSCLEFIDYFEHNNNIIDNIAGIDSNTSKPKSSTYFPSLCFNNNNHFSFYTYL